jgi:hypothetical protein
LAFTTSTNDRSLAQIFQNAHGPEATSVPSPQAATLSEQGLHKRQISEPIPREERENERTEGARIAQETPQQENEAT